MRKQNYRQMKSQKENARKARNAEKLQRRQPRLPDSDQPQDGVSQDLPDAPGDTEKQPE